MDAQTQALVARLTTNVTNANNLAQHLQQRVVRLEASVNQLTSRVTSVEMEARELSERIGRLEDRVA